VWYIFGLYSQLSYIDGYYIFYTDLFMVIVRRTNTAVPMTRPDTPATWATSKRTTRVWRSSRTLTHSSRWSEPTTSWVELWSCTLTPTTWAAEGSPTAWPPDTPVPGWRAESSESCRHTISYSRNYYNYYFSLNLLFILHERSYGDVCFLQGFLSYTILPARVIFLRSLYTYYYGNLSHALHLYLICSFHFFSKLFLRSIRSLIIL